VEARAGAFIALLVVTPVVAVLLLTREPDNALQHEQSSAFIAYALVLGAAVFVYFGWRMRMYEGSGMGSRMSGWLTVGLVVAAVQGLVGAVTATQAPPPTVDRWPLVQQVVQLLVLCLLARAAERRDVPIDPALAGGIVALALTAGYVATLAAAPPLVLSSEAVALLDAAVLVTGLALAVLVLRSACAPMWVRQRLAGVAVVLAAAQCLTNVAGRHTPAMFVIVIANVGGAMVLGAVIQTLMRRSLHAYHQEMLLLQKSLAEAKAGVQGERELLHEVGSTLAGIATASRLIQDVGNIEPTRRQRLEAMVAAEFSRLERLMSERAPSRTYDYAVDDVVEPLVVSHQTRGRDVRWQPSGLFATGDPDDLAEVVNILLENAGRHGAGHVELVVRPDADFVEVSCSDSGPGIAPEVRESLFTSGVRGPDSEGHGYGLAIARRIMTDAGGSLELDDLSTQGATFVARVPRSEVDRVASSNVA
jgi:signal transduction histidine kinase